MKSVHPCLKVKFTLISVQITLEKICIHFFSQKLIGQTEIFCHRWQPAKVKDNWIQNQMGMGLVTPSCKSRHRSNWVYETWICLFRNDICQLLHAQEEEHRSSFDKFQKSKLKIASSLLFFCLALTEIANKKL